MSNYFLFDYTCEGHSFDCSCGSSRCYKRVNGFKSLSFDDKIRLVDQLSENVLHSFISDCFSHEEIDKMYRSQLQPGPVTT
jgi:hypothetical protein